MFGEAVIELGVEREVIVLPVTSVRYAPYGNSVYILKALDDPSSLKQNEAAPREARQQIVQLGARRGDFVAILSGVNVGDEVVTLGTFKLRPGALVIPRQDQSVPAKLNPEVKNS
jgi:membrane fusion protein (multidrug efflux system)